MKVAQSVYVLQCLIKLSIIFWKERHLGIVFKWYFLISTSPLSTALLHPCLPWLASLGWKICTLEFPSQSAQCSPYPSLIKMELYFHKPMFYFLSMLAFINLVLFLTTVLKMQSFFWFNTKDITLSICLIRLLALARHLGPASPTTAPSWSYTTPLLSCG